MNYQLLREPVVMNRLQCSALWLALTAWLQTLLMTWGLSYAAGSAGRAGPSQPQHVVRPEF